MTKTKINWNETQNAVFEMEDGSAFVLRLFSDRVQVLHSKTVTVEPHPHVAGALEIGFDDRLGQWAGAKMDRLSFRRFAKATPMGAGKRDVLAVLNMAMAFRDGQMVRDKIPYAPLKTLIDAIQTAGEADGTMPASIAA
jgi:hypothetical protein